LDLETFRGSKKWGDIDGLVDAVNSAVFPFRALNVLQGILFAP
jgi:hypothetical protein